MTFFPSQQDEAIESSHDAKIWIEAPFVFNEDDAEFSNGSIQYVAQHSKGPIEYQRSLEVGGITVFGNPDDGYVPAAFITDLQISDPSRMIDIRASIFYENDRICPSIENWHRVTGRSKKIYGINFLPIPGGRWIRCSDVTEIRAS